MYRLPDNLRADLAKPLGPVLPDAEGSALAKRAPFVVAVGDVTTERLLAAGVVPRLVVIDHKTKRTTETAAADAAVATLVKRGAPVVRVANPAAVITEDLWNAVAAALAGAVGGGCTVLEVDGEEDLAALPAVALAPKGALVCYGQPDQGMVVVTVDDAVRAKVRQFLSKMET